MNKINKGYRNLIAWQFANRLAHATYDATENFPRTEAFGLVSQMRRAAVSVAANIAEGFIKAKKDRRRFYIIAMASLTELEYYIDFASERNLYSKEVYENLSALQTETAKILTGLIRSIK